MKRLVWMASFTVLLSVFVYGNERQESPRAQKRGRAAAAKRALPGLPAANFTQDPGGGSTENCGDIDPTAPCYVNGGSGGPYSYCLAKRSLGQKCRDVVTVYTNPGTMCANGCNTCASVNYSASCQCDNSTMKLSGSCTYW